MFSIVKTLPQKTCCKSSSKRSANNNFERDGERAPQAERWAIMNTYAKRATVETARAIIDGRFGLIEARARLAFLASVRLKHEKTSIEMQSCRPVEMSFKDFKMPSNRIDTVRSARSTAQALRACTAFYAGR